MKLCIVKPDGTVAEILLRDRQPSFEAFNNEQLFFENYQYKFILREIEEYENVEIFVGDYSVPIHYKASTDWYETDQDLVFGGCFDLAYISVWVSEKEGIKAFIKAIRLSSAFSATAYTPKKPESTSENKRRNTTKNPVSPKSPSPIVPANFTKIPANTLSARICKIVFFCASH